MGRYTGPKARVNRRLGFNVFESAGALRASERKPFPPGMAQRRRKATQYGLALTEKQKIKFYYGIREQQLRKYFAAAKRQKGNTGEILLVHCECRLDNVVRRAGFTHSRPQARQGIVHGHFQLNGRTVTRPSIQVKAGDIVTVKKRPNLTKMYAELIASGTRPETSWVAFDADALKAIVTSLPSMDDVSIPVNVGQVVAFMSR
jgi:small subunit ribosomal protein S4